MRRIAILSLVAVSACASTGTPSATAEPETVRIVGPAGGRGTTLSTMSTRAADEVTFNAAVADVWRIMPAVYDSLGIPIAERNDAGHMIGNPSLRVRRQLGRVRLGRYFDCGSTQGGNSADTYDMHLSVVSQVHEKEPGKAMVSTTIEALAKPVNFAGDWYRCVSTSALESRIVELVRGQLEKKE
jgi:hypothetical protein